MKILDAVLTIKVRVSSVMDEDDVREGLDFDTMVRDLVEAEGPGLGGLSGIADDEFELVEIKRVERDE